jgi:hypothetical protein
LWLQHLLSSNPATVQEANRVGYWHLSRHSTLALSAAFALKIGKLEEKPKTTTTSTTMSTMTKTTTTTMTTTMMTMTTTTTTTTLQEKFHRGSFYIFSARWRFVEFNNLRRRRKTFKSKTQLPVEEKRRKNLEDNFLNCCHFLENAASENLSKNFSPKATSVQLCNRIYGIISGSSVVSGQQSVVFSPFINPP